jgi:tetratricopeptide (TPR) repeat protein
LLVAGVVLTVNTILLWQEQKEKAEALEEKAGALEEKARALEEKGNALAQSEASLDVAFKVLDEIYVSAAEKRLDDETKLAPEDRVFLQKALGFYQQLAVQHTNDPAVRQRAGRAYHRVGDIQFKFGQHAEGEAAYLAAATIFQKLTNEFPGNSEYRLQLSKTFYALGKELGDLGRFGEAIQALDRTKSIVSEVEEKHLKTDVQKEEARCFHCLGLQYQRTNNHPDAEQSYRKAIALFQSLAESRPNETHYLASLGFSTSHLAGVLQRDRPQEAEKLHKQAVDLLERAVAVDANVKSYQHQLGICHNNLADFLEVSLRFDEAVNAYRQAIVVWEKSEHWPNVGFAYLGLGECLQKLDRVPEAERAFQLAISFKEKVAKQSPNVPRYERDVAATQIRLGDFLRDTGRPREADGAYRKALHLYEGLVAGFPNETQYCEGLFRIYERLTSLSKSSGQPGQAEQVYRLAIALWEKQPARPMQGHASQIALAGSVHKLGDILLETGQPQPAEEAYRRSLTLWDSLRDQYPQEADYSELASLSQVRIGMTQRERGDTQQANKTFEQVRTAIRTRAVMLNNIAWRLATNASPRLRHSDWAVTLGKDAIELAPEKGVFWNTLGVAHYRAGDWRMALAALERSMELGNGGNSSDWFFLAMCHRQLGDEEKAREWFERAVQWMDKNQPKDDELHRFRAEAAEVLKIDDKLNQKSK